jgi:hypothetical protein
MAQLGDLNRHQLEAVRSVTGSSVLEVGGSPQSCIRLRMLNSGWMFGKPEVVGGVN